MLRFLSTLGLLFLYSCSWFVPQDLEQNSTITGNYTAAHQIYTFNGHDTLEIPVLTIETSNAVIDFNESLIQGSNDKSSPDEYYGLCILVKNCENVVIRNVKIRGYKVAIRVQNSKNVRISHSDLSYNYRPKIRSTREREDPSDWLSYHDNENTEWFYKGSGIYVENSTEIQIDHTTMSNQLNGIMLVNSSTNLIYNNTIVFNSGIGIGLYRSNQNRIMHNNLNFNVRGYSHDKFSRGQDSAALLLYEQSSDNVIAYNSATHSGDGLFLWAGNSTLETAKGGSNHNLIYGNDFSFSPTNGIELTFSTNIVVNNYVEGSKYGLWGGFSYETIIHNNFFLDQKYGVAIENGQNNRISNNVIMKSKETGIRLWTRSDQPDWPLVKLKDTKSRDHTISFNSIINAKNAFDISRTSNINIENNNMFGNDSILVESENENLNIQNNVSNEETYSDFRDEWLSNLFDHPEDSLSNAYYVAPLVDGMNPFTQYQDMNGREHIMITNWGPYDFKSPYVYLRSNQNNLYEYEIFGPVGRWSYYSARNAVLSDNKTGDVPGKVYVLKLTDEEDFDFNLTYSGEEIITPFGVKISENVSTIFKGSRYILPLPWNVKWYNKNARDVSINFKQWTQSRRHQSEEQTNFIEYQWWDSPSENVNQNNFVTVAETTGFFESGRYKIGLTSDDGIHFEIDGKTILTDWNHDATKFHELNIELSGRHSFRVFHQDKQGFAALMFSIKRDQE